MNKAAIVLMLVFTLLTITHAQNSGNGMPGAFSHFPAFNQKYDEQILSEAEFEEHFLFRIYSATTEEDFENYGFLLESRGWNYTKSEDSKIYSKSHNGLTWTWIYSGNGQALWMVNP